MLKIDKDTVVPVGLVGAVIVAIVSFVTYIGGVSSTANATVNQVAEIRSTYPPRFQRLEDRDMQLLERMNANQKEIIDRLSKIEGKLAR